MQVDVKQLYVVYSYRNCHFVKTDYTRLFAHKHDWMQCDTYTGLILCSQ